MKIALVLCPSWSRDTPPFGIAMLKGYLAARGHRVTCFDVSQTLFESAGAEERTLWGTEHASMVWTDEAFVDGFVSRSEPAFRKIEDAILGVSPRIVGFSLYASNELMTLRLARRLKRRDPSLIVVVGGPQCTGRGQALLREEPAVDAVVPGEGELALAALADDPARALGGDIAGAWVRGGAFREAPVVEPLDSLPFADFTDFPVGAYARPRRFPIYFSRGCFKKCVFCDVSVLWKSWRVRSGRRVFEELIHQRRRHPAAMSFQFYDPLLNSDLAELEEFCDLMIAGKASGDPLLRGACWFGNAIVRYDMKRPLIDKMARAGCHNLQIGIESGSQRVLNEMKKGYLLREADRTLADLHAAGIDTVVNLMVGFPTETERDFQDTLDFMRRNAYAIGRISASENTTLMRGTALHEHARDVYGVEGSHPEFWTRASGATDYRVRLDRFERLSRLAQDLGIPQGEQFDRFSAYKDRMLNRYDKFLAAEATA